MEYVALDIVDFVVLWKRDGILQSATSFYEPYITTL